MSSNRNLGQVCGNFLLNRRSESLIRRLAFNSMLNRCNNEKILSGQNQNITNNRIFQQQCEFR